MQMLCWLIVGINLPPAPTAQYQCIYEVVEDGSNAGDSVPGWYSEVTLSLCMFEQGLLFYICLDAVQQMKFRWNLFCKGKLFRCEVDFVIVR